MTETSTENAQISSPPIPEEIEIIPSAANSAQISNVQTTNSSAPGPSQSSNPILNRIGRFHIQQPFRGALGGLSSLLGRGRGKNANEEGENQKEEQKLEKNSEEKENGGKGENGQIGEEGEILEPIEMDKEGNEAKTDGNGEKQTMGMGPAPKPRRRLRRGSSVVHPSAGEEGAPVASSGDAIAPAIRPRSLSARKLQRPLEASKQSQWIYVQMPDRTFKRTTEAELQSRRQTIGGGEGQMDAANLPEFASVKMAIGIQSTFHGISIILQGFLSGLAFGHAAFAWILFPAKLINKPDVFIAQFYAPLAIPIQIFFYFCLTLAAIDAMDRYRLPNAPSIAQFLRQSFISAQFFSVFCWISAFLASICCAQVDEYFARNDLEIIKKNDWLLLSIWCWSSAFRAIFCIFGWLLIAQNPSKNAIGEELRRMIQIGEIQQNEGKIGKEEEEKEDQSKKA